MHHDELTNESVLIPERVYTLRGRDLVILVRCDSPERDDDDVLGIDDALAFYPQFHPTVHDDDPVASAQSEAVDRGEDAAEQAFPTDVAYLHRHLVIYVHEPVNEASAPQTRAERAVKASERRRRKGDNHVVARQPEKAPQGQHIVRHGV